MTEPGAYLERVCLAACAVQGEGGDRRQALVVRSGHERGLDCGDDLTVATEGELRLEPEEGGPVPLPGEALALCHRRAGDVEPLEGPATPEVEGALEELPGSRVVAAGHGLTGLVQFRAEALEIERLGVDHERVPGRPFRDRSLVLGLRELLGHPPPPARDLLHGQLPADPSRYILGNFRGIIPHLLTPGSGRARVSQRRTLGRRPVRCGPPSLIFRTVHLPPSHRCGVSMG